MYRSKHLLTTVRPLTAPDRTGQQRIAPDHTGPHRAYNGPEITDCFALTVISRIKRGKAS